MPKKVIVLEEVLCCPDCLTLYPEKDVKGREEFQYEKFGGGIILICPSCEEKLERPKFWSAPPEKAD